MTKAKFFKLAEEHGIEVTYTPPTIDRWTNESFGWNIMLDAPDGFAFSESELTTDCSIQGEGKTDWTVALYELQKLIDQWFIESDYDCED
jgi:hypothetical protein